jgi:RimJ/RimL family protein N-acetyltransferase
MSASIRTERLLLVPLTHSQLEHYLTDLPELERDLDLTLSREVLTDRVRAAIQMKLAKMEALDEEYHLWVTYWLVIIRVENFGAGMAGFKGVPDAGGSTEIGYGIDPSYQSKGYMTETVRALVNWALDQPACQIVTAIEVKNPASRRLLEKLGAHLVSKDAAFTSWKFRR